MANREWAACVRDDARREQGGCRKRARGGGEACVGGCKQETCFEILICGSGHGLVH